MWRELYVQFERLGEKGYRFVSFDSSVSCNCLRNEPLSHMDDSPIWFLCSFYFSMEPFFLFESARWLVVRNITIPHLAYVGLVFFMLGVGVFVISCVQLFRRWKKGLVTYGLYSVVRHPQYVGLIIGTLGFSLMNLRPASLIMWITLVFGYVLLADSEERDLERKYEEAFHLYKQKVPFMLPILPPNFIEQTIKLPKSRLKRYTINTTVYLLTITITTIILYAFLPEPPPIFRS